MKRLLLGTLMVLGLLASCGGGGANPPKTVGEACGDIGDSWCERARECFPSGAPSQTACANDFVKGCCQDKGTCANPARAIGGEEWNQCLDGFGDLTCPEVKAGDLPTPCLSL